MKRNLRKLCLGHNHSTASRVLETINTGVVAAAMLACTALALVAPTPGVPGKSADRIAVVELEGLVVTPDGSYGAKAWAARQLARRASMPLALSRPLPQRQCRLPSAPVQPRTQTC
ncbi:MAG: hypothetical protein EPN60_11645 [Nevskiaceae bacterium]|jgi:hypothetical protein|nr:MAG: hypothetical protein EPO48_04030 [Nevskiaceae bacterium]TAM25773.1 MAG: hypothetical protein EPN60_11645 [Nevskiaceae bacterium]